MPTLISRLRGLLGRRRLRQALRHAPRLQSMTFAEVCTELARRSPSSETPGAARGSHARPSSAEPPTPGTATKP